MEKESNEMKKRWITDWWPNRHNLKVLRQNCSHTSPYGPEYKYLHEFEQLNLQEVKEDLKALMTSSQDWCPADLDTITVPCLSGWPGTLREAAGSSMAGERREPALFVFAREGDRPDNTNLDKAVRLLR